MRRRVLRAIWHGGAGLPQRRVQEDTQEGSQEDPEDCYPQGHRRTLEKPGGIAGWKYMWKTV